MSLFKNELKSNKVLFTVSIIFLVFIIIEGIQALNYPLIILGIVPDYHKEIAQKMFPLYFLFDPIIIFPFIIINLVLRIIAFFNLLRLNKAGKSFGIISSAFTLLLVIVMLPVNIIWEPAAMIILIILLIKGYKQTDKMIMKN
ncbi:MAG: hypothetical protein A2014_02680 [Spirochaetes bacterium GWF1_49_6]|nr:MAG: hypothetical protein A2014_02680 [Spirochaetes bacterium GWF1_49_6]